MTERYKKALDVWNQGTRLNEDDYHSSTGMMSNSFIGAFQKCEYSAIIADTETQSENSKKCFAEGHLIEAYIFEGEEGFNKMKSHYGDFLIDSRTLNTTKKELKWVNDALVTAKFMAKHPLAKFIQSESSKYHEIITFELEGVMFRAEIDCLNLNKETEIDVKTVGYCLFDKQWNGERKVNFIEAHNYTRQRALYQLGIKDKYDVLVTPRIYAGSKKTRSCRMFKFDDQVRLDDEIENIKPVIERFQEVLGGAEPHKCEVCSHCVENEVIDFEILTSSFCANY